MRLEMYFEEKDLKHLVKRLKPLINQKIDWCGTGTMVSKEDEILKRLVGEMKYMIENPDICIDKPKALECVCTKDIVCCECGEELFEDDYASSPEPFADEMHDYFVIHRRCEKCQQEKEIKAREFVKHIDTPYFWKLNPENQNLKKNLKKFWRHVLLETDSKNGDLKNCPVEQEGGKCPYDDGYCHWKNCKPLQKINERVDKRNESKEE